MGRFLAFLLGVAGAVIGSQGPGFTLQYMQNLEGRVSELQTLVEQYDADIAAYGYTRAQAMAECETATQLLDAMCGGYETAVARYERLSAHLTELEAVSDYVRPLILARTEIREITLSVYEQFEPAIPATLPGGVYAGGGFALLWGASSFLFGLLGGLFGGRRRYA